MYFVGILFNILIVIMCLTVFISSLSKSSLILIKHEGFDKILYSLITGLSSSEIFRLSVFSFSLSSLIFSFLDELFSLD